MSVTYGFYNSLNGDRKYNTVQMSSIFDGIIKDGVFMSIGTCLMVTEYSGGANMMVDVGIGRAWFDHTWTLNDAILPLEIPEAEVLLNRYDAVVLEVDATEEVRANSIKIVKGTPSSNPTYPTLVSDGDIHQYPLAYVYVAKGATTITQSNITNMVGTSSTPFVTGILETVNIDGLIAKWEDQWNRFLSGNGDEWNEWFLTFTNQNAAALNNWTDAEKQEFLDWFNSLRVILDGDVATNLTERLLSVENRVTTLEDCCKTLADEQMMLYSVDDSDEDAILDSDGNKIQGRILYVIK